MANGILPQDFWIEYALRQIKRDYGIDASIEEKDKELFKYGDSTQVNSSSRVTLMTLPTGTLNETYATGNTIAYVSSADNSDTGEMVVEGHTLSGTDFTFVVQTVTLAGQTKTALTTPLARCTRMYNNTSFAWTGPVYVYEDDTVTAGVPATGAKVSCMINAGEQQSEKASTTLSSRDYWIITSARAGVLTKTANSLADVRIETRLDTKVFRPRAQLCATSGITDTLAPHPYIIIPANSDVRMTALGSGNLEVFGFMRGLLAIDRTNIN